MMLKKISFVVISLGLFLAAASQLYAGNNSGSNFQVKPGFYIQGLLLQNNIKGEFNDSTLLYSDTAVFNVPSVDKGSGFGIALGGKSNFGAFEISYLTTDHKTDTAFTDIGEQDATFNIVNFDFKYDLAKSQMRPYLQFGFGFPWLTIKNSKYDESYGDETFRGLALNLGGGVAYYMTPQWSLNGGVIYRWTSFRTVDSVTIKGNLKGSGTQFLLGIAYTF